MREGPLIFEAREPKYFLMCFNLTQANRREQIH